MNLYKKAETIDFKEVPSFLDKNIVPQLTENHRSLCEDNITMDELFKTLKAFKKDKSPGLDGLTAEFYIEFWELLKDKLKGIYDETFANGILPESLRTGVIVLLEKKGKNRMDIANWRPITLLGVDYKLLTKTLAERLKKVLPGLIHTDQNGFVPGGNIIFSAHSIRDILLFKGKARPYTSCFRLHQSLRLSRL